MTNDKGEEILTASNEILFRQVHPDFVNEGKITSQAFRPTTKDEGMLSVDRDSKTDAKKSFELHIGCRQGFE